MTYYIINHQHITEGLSRAYLTVSSPIILIARSTSGTAQARHSGPFTSWHIKTLPVPRLLLGAIQLLRLTLFDPKVLLPALTHGEHPSLVFHLRVVTSSLSKVVSRTFSSPPMLKVGASFRLLASRSPCVPGRLELFLTMLPLGSSDSTFSLQSAPSVCVAIARWKHVDTSLPTAAGLPTFP